jgi:hypothetical protein
MSDQTEQREGAARLPPASPGKFRLTKGEVSTLMKSVAEVLAPLVKRVQALEARPAFKYLGVWDSKTQYVRGCFVTDKGSIWHCNDMTMARPGDSPAWTLACKRGADGKDGR